MSFTVASLGDLGLDPGAGVCWQLAHGPLQSSEHHLPHLRNGPTWVGVAVRMEREMTQDKGLVQWAHSANGGSRGSGIWNKVSAQQTKLIEVMITTMLGIQQVLKN